MRRIEAFIAIMLFLFSYAHARNSQIGYEKKEIGISVKVKASNNTEAYYTLSYAFSRKFEAGIGFGKNAKDCEINYHFIHGKRVDPYLGGGLSFYKEGSTGYSTADTLYQYPINSYYDRSAGLIICGLNYWVIKNVSIGVENFIRIRKNKLSNSPFFAFKFAF